MSFQFWLKQNLIALDQQVNALFGGWADETISARCWRERARQPFKTIQKTLDFFFSQHCELSFQSERKRSQSPPEEREPDGKH